MLYEAPRLQVHICHLICNYCTTHGDSTKNYFFYCCCRVHCCCCCLCLSVLPGTTTRQILKISKSQNLKSSSAHGCAREKNENEKITPPQKQAEQDKTKHGRLAAALLLFCSNTAYTQLYTPLTQRYRQQRHQGLVKRGWSGSPCAPNGIS